MEEKNRLTLFLTAYWNEKFPRGGGVWGPPSENGHRGHLGGWKLVYKHPKGFHGGTQTHFAQKPYWKIFMGSKKRPFFAKNAENGLFWPFFDPKMGRRAKIKRFDQIFFAPPHIKSWLRKSQWKSASFMYWKFFSTVCFNFERASNAPPRVK